MRILVIGAHGRLGGRLVALLLSRGYSVCALVRRQSQADALSGLGVKAMVGDLRGDVEWAVDGCDAAIFADRPRLGDHRKARPDRRSLRAAPARRISLSD